MSLVDAFAWAPGPVTDAFAWVVVALFALGAGLEYRARRGGFDGRSIESGTGARGVTALAWGLFAAFWASLFPHFAFVHKSYVEGVLVAAAVPAALYTGATLWRGRESLFVLSRAVAVMGLVYLPFETVPSVSVAGVRLPAPERYLIETVAGQTGALMGLLGYSPELVAGEQGYLNTFRFVTADGHVLLFSIVLACTGLGSIAIFAGLIAAVRAPVGRKLRALGVAIPVIYVLNVLRTTFIGVVFGNQYMQVFVSEVLFLFGGEDPYKVSWYLSDRVISQLLAVVALVGVTYLVVRQLPELLTVIEDVLYLLTDEEHDLSETLDLPRERSERVEGRPQGAD